MRPVNKTKRLLKKVADLENVVGALRCELADLTENFETFSNHFGYEVVNGELHSYASKKLPLLAISVARAEADALIDLS